MSAVPPIAPVATGLATSPLAALQPAAPQGGGFADMLAQGLANMETKVAQADDLVRRFAVDGDVPVHQVTFALEEARLSVELAMQVRARLTEAYRDLMNMQL